MSNLCLTPARGQWAVRTAEALLAQPALALTVLDAESDPTYLEWFHDREREGKLSLVTMPREGSLFRRYLLAEALAESEYFLMCDNDMLPKTEGWLSRGLEVMRAHPQFGHVVYRMEHSDFSGDHAFEDQDVRSIAKGGGFNLIRRDARTAPFRVPFIFDPNNADDKCYCSAIRESGRLVGQFQRLYVEHIGRQESTQTF